ncbi:MAG: hypothetical protein ACD_62C00084G0001, partial [uncultured bacterium]
MSELKIPDGQVAVRAAVSFEQTSVEGNSEPGIGLQADVVGRIFFGEGPVQGVFGGDLGVSGAFLQADGELSTQDQYIDPEKTDPWVPEGESCANNSCYDTMNTNHIALDTNLRGGVRIPLGKEGANGTLMVEGFAGLDLSRTPKGRAPMTEVGTNDEILPLDGQADLSRAVALQGGGTVTYEPPKGRFSFFLEAGGHSQATSSLTYTHQGLNNITERSRPVHGNVYIGGGMSVRLGKVKDTAPDYDDEVDAYDDEPDFNIEDALDLADHRVNSDYPDCSLVPLEGISTRRSTLTGTDGAGSTVSLATASAEEVFDERASGWFYTLNNDGTALKQGSAYMSYFSAIAFCKEEAVARDTAGAEPESGVDAEEVEVVPFADAV